jgi:glycosyltransferase involved in cell wall biosynthesis
MTTRGLKVLYCCAFAHYTGHFPSSALHETKALSDNGIDIILLTFKGLVDDTEPKVPYLRVDYESGWFGNLLIKKADMLRRNRITRRLSMLIEWYMVLDKAIKLKKELGIDVIHLRDGEPFPFLVHLFGCFNKGLKFLVSFTGTNLLQYKKIQGISALIYLWLLKVVNNKMWSPVYCRSLMNNKFVFTTQNEVIKERFSYEFMGGILNGRVVYNPLWVTGGKVINKTEARHELEILQNAYVFLLFGNVHVGKDMKTPLIALQALLTDADIKNRNFDVVMLQAGDDKVLNTDFNDIKAMAESYGVSANMVIHNQYIPENRKHLYFCASDACILAYHGSFASATSVLWESAGYKTPVIVADIGDLGKLTRAYRLGCVYAANDPYSLAEAMMSFIAMKDKGFETGFEKFSVDFSSQRWAKRCTALYHGL